MKKILGLLVLSTGLLAGCASKTPSPYAQNCIKTTPQMSAARWDCLQGEPKQTDSNSQQPKQQTQAPTTQSSNKASNAAFVTAICSTLSKGKAAECAAGALNSDESELARKLRQQDDEIEALKRQQAIDRSRQRQKDSDRDYDKRREDLMNWKPGRKYTY